MILIGGNVILRVIAGKLKGIRILTPKGKNTRPTTDRVKESMFNIIQNYVKGAKVLDLFAGSGNLGIESLSRGSLSVDFVDCSKESISIIKENLIKLKFEDCTRVIMKDFESAIKEFLSEGKRFDLIFLDPPYKKQFFTKALTMLADNDIVEDDGLIVVESEKDENLPQNVLNLNIWKQVIYGGTKLTFYINDIIK